MSNTVYSTSWAVAQRLAMSEISLMTHQAGLAMCTRFRLGRMGHIRVSDAVKNLRSYYGFERVLWFGFGHKSFLALLTECEAGFNCAALCASLAEAYGTDRSAQLLQALWRVQGLSNALEPSRSQLYALVSGCSEVLLATPFLDVLRRIAGPREYSVISTSTVDARSDDWARAVDGMF